MTGFVPDARRPRSKILWPSVVDVKPNAIHSL